MINLLPSSAKEDFMYARRNTMLLHWVVALAVVLIGVGAIIGAGYLYLNKTASDLSSNIEVAKDDLKKQNIEETKKKVESVTNNTKLAVDVLSREILFSKLLRQLGAALPANTYLQQLQIDEVQGGLTLIVGATDINAATQAQLNLEDPANKIFEKADIENINCEKTETNTTYPCTAQIRALFTKENPFLFIAPSNSKEVTP